MGPDELEELLNNEPFVPVRLTLASGDVVIVERSVQWTVAGLTLSLEPGSGSYTGSSTRHRLISIPNVCLAERLDMAPPSVTRRRR